MHNSPPSSSTVTPPFSFWSFIALSLKREWLLVFRNRADIANPLIFFFSILMFVPLGITPDAKVLSNIAPGLIWIIALLATLLSLDRLFVSDFENGSLDQMMVSGQSMFWIVMCKCLVHWSVTGLPLTLLSPILGLMLSLPATAYIALMASLLLGTFVLSMIGAVGASLLVSLKKGGVLLSLIVMPLYVPVLIFGSGAVNSAAVGLDVTGQFAILGAMVLLAMVLAPLAAAAAIIISLRNH